MFTGIVEELGRLEGISSIARGSQLRIGADLVLDGLEEGESLAVDGVCLTVTEVGRSSFSVQVVKNTLEETTLGRVRVGSNPVSVDGAAVGGVNRRGAEGAETDAEKREGG